MHQLLVYNLAVKLPVIAATVGLAYLVGAVLQRLGASPAASRRAWTFLLLNPFVLYVGAAWGQIDTIVALLALAALVLLSTGRRDGSAGLLALAFTVKPIALPVLPVALVAVAAGSWRKAARYGAIFLGGVVALYVLPFFVFGWSLDPFFRHLNAHFLMHGTLSYMTVVRVFRDLDLLQGSWWLLGLIWVVALAVGTVLLGRGDGSLEDLLKKSTALLLIVFLTRTWLAEANVMLVLPLVLILASTGALDRRALTAVWVIPLLFTVLNASPLHLLWVAFPETMRTSLAAVFPYSHAALLARAVLVIVWQVAGWWIVVVCMKRKHGARRGDDSAAGGRRGDRAGGSNAAREARAVEVTVPLRGDLALRIADGGAGDGPYPTRRLQKGLLLLCAGRELAEEGVGFGVPVLKRGVQTIFPGGVELAWRQDGADWEVAAAFRMDLVERLSGPDGARVGSTAAVRRQGCAGRAASPRPGPARPAHRHVQRPASRLRLGDDLRGDRSRPGRSP